MRYVIAAVVLFVVSHHVGAQTSADYSGYWSVDFTNKNGKRIDVELIINGNQGTWKVYGQAAYKIANCLGRRFPLTVTKATADELAFLVDGDAVIGGCGKRRVSLIRVGSNALAGTVNGGGSIRITRE